MPSISESHASLAACDRVHRPQDDKVDRAEARWVCLLVGAGAILFFTLGWTRYIFFRAGVSDLGYFDQAVYLISRGKPPFIPTLGFQMLADHGAYMIYPLALLYRIYPSVLWLFAVQAISLAGSAMLVWRLARQAGVGAPMGSDRLLRVARLPRRGDAQPP